MQIVRDHKRIIKLETFGNVDQTSVDKYLDVLTESYEKLGPPLSYSATLRVFEKSSGDVFFASHDALEGKPTINIYLEKISSLPHNT